MCLLHQCCGIVYINICGPALWWDSNNIHKVLCGQKRSILIVTLHHNSNNILILVIMLLTFWKRKGTLLWAEVYLLALAIIWEIEAARSRLVVKSGQMEICNSATTNHTTTCCPVHAKAKLHIWISRFAESQIWELQVLQICMYIHVEMQICYVCQQECIATSRLKLRWFQYYGPCLYMIPCMTLSIPQPQKCIIKSIRSYM